MLCHMTGPLLERDHNTAGEPRGLPPDPDKVTPVRIRLVSTVLAICACVPWAHCVSTAAPGPFLRAPEVLAAINGSRVHQGLTPLVLDARLTAAAHDKLADMLHRRYFDHKNPDGKYVWGTMARERCAYVAAAENLARGYADEDAMEESWMRSPPHRMHILSARYRVTGIAVWQDPPTAVVLFADTCG